MAPIECPECGREISDKESACPQCGYDGGSTPLIGTVLPRPKDKHQEIIDMLVDRVPKSRAVDLVKECTRIGMEQVEYQNIGGSDLYLRPFDVGYHFRFDLDDVRENLFEILEKDEFVVQSGYQVVPPMYWFFSKTPQRYSQIKKILASHYDISEPMKMETEAGTAEIINYGNDTTIAYISKINDVITIRVGNRRFWD